jgi:hypothetical protein
MKGVIEILLEWSDLLLIFVTIVPFILAPFN